MNDPGYLGTLVRTLLVAAAMGSAMLLVYRGLRRAGRKEPAAAGWAFCLPWVIGGAIFLLVPMLMSLVLGMTRYGVLSAPRWVGLAHYVRIFTADRMVQDAAVNTAVFAVATVTLGIVSSLGAALLLSLPWRLMGLWRAIYYLPSVVPAVSTALLWRWIFVPDGGLANQLLGALGLPTPGWFADPRWVIPAFVIMSLQGACGNNMVIFLAKIRGIDASLYEAAVVDGAGRLSRLWHITLPQLSPVIFYHLVMGVIGSMQIFTKAMFIQTPGRSGMFYAVYIYRTGWQELRMGYACALSWVLLAALVVLTALVFRSSRWWVTYEQSDIQAREDSPVLRATGWRRRVWKLAIIAGGLVMLVPILWMISTSLKTPADLVAWPPKLLSWPPRWRNFTDAWGALPFGRFLANTVFITVLAAGGQVLTSAVVAYGLARFRFRGRRVLLGAVLATLMIPGMVMMVPVFLLWRTVGMVGTFDPLVLGALLGGSPLLIFIAHQFLRTLPKELEEAAMLDGASRPRVFFQIIVPSAWPVLLVMCLIAFQTHWNDFLGPLLYLNRMEQYTMTMGLHFFQGAYMGEAPKWHWMMAMTVLMSLPTVAVFLATQRVMYRGMRASN